MDEQTITHTGGNGTYSLKSSNLLASGNYQIVVRDATGGQLVYETVILVLAK